MPGCPPETEQIADVIGLVAAALDGKAVLPPRGVGAGRRPVDRVRRVRARSRGQADRPVHPAARTCRASIPNLCLLEQGVPCNGPATRDGCGAKCPLAGAPCIGCYGPADGVVDFGARLLSAFASVVDASEPDDIDRILDGLPDPVGQFYRFSLAGSLLRGSRRVRTTAAGPAVGAAPAATASSGARP